MEENNCITVTVDTCPRVNFYVDGVQVFVGSPDVYIFYYGTDADALKRRIKYFKGVRLFWGFGKSTKTK